ncbi:MAG: putative signal transducing protein [Terriglobales bacterium]
MTDTPNPNQKLETVFDTADETEAAVVQGLLESAGLECLATSPDAPGEVMTGLGGVVLQVSEEHAEEARRLIEEYRAGAASEDEPEKATGTG